MTEIRHIINIYLALENYIEKQKENGNKALEEDIQNTLNWLIEKNVTETYKQSTKQERYNEKLDIKNIL